MFCTCFFGKNVVQIVPHNLKEKGCVCVTLPSGVTDVRFSLVGSGPASSTAKITYSWPLVMSSIEGLFASEISNGKMDPSHPIIVGLKQELEGYRSNIEDIPYCLPQLICKQKT